MTELTPSTRALLDAARGSGPDAAALARMRAKIGGAVAAAPPVVAASSATSTLAAKLGVFAIAALVVTGAILFATRSNHVDPVVVQLADPPIAGTVRTAREVSPPAAVVEEIEMPATHRAPRTKSIELAREVELVDRAMAALRHNDPRAALAAVRLYTSEAGQRGQLAEDAAAVEVEALCTLRDPTAAARRTAFETRWPASAQRARLGRACSL